MNWPVLKGENLGICETEQGTHGFAATSTSESESDPEPLDESSDPPQNLDDMVYERSKRLRETGVCRDFGSRKPGRRPHKISTTWNLRQATTKNVHDDPLSCDGGSFGWVASCPMDDRNSSFRSWTLHNSGCCCSVAGWTNTRHVQKQQQQRVQQSM